MPYQDLGVGGTTTVSRGGSGGPRRGGKAKAKKSLAPASSPRPKLRPSPAPTFHWDNSNDNSNSNSYSPPAAPPPPQKYNLTLGYDAIPVFRPKFIYFEFTGLRPNTPHWIFFGGKQVNKWVNTDKTEDDLINAGRNSKLKEPGDSYKTATSFPTAQGGPSNGGGDDALTTTAEGKLSGIFFLQSNDDLSFPISAAGIDMIATDIETINLDKCKSFAGATFRGYGQYENYFRGTSSQIAQAKEIQATLAQNSTPSEEIV